MGWARSITLTITLKLEAKMEYDLAYHIRKIRNCSNPNFLPFVNILQKLFEIPIERVFNFFIKLIASFLLP